jgi:hypothetical protein
MESAEGNDGVTKMLHGFATKVLQLLGLLSVVADEEAILVSLVVVLLPRRHVHPILRAMVTSSTKDLLLDSIGVGFIL